MSVTPRLISRATFASSSRSASVVCRPMSTVIRSFVDPTSRLAVRPSLARPTAPQATLRWASSASATSTSTSPSSIADSIFSSKASSAGTPPIRVTPPSLQAIKDEGFMDDDVQLVPEDEARLIITPEAIQQLANITAREPPDVLAKGKLALRVGVESGGCHGYQYTMALTEERGLDDYVMQPEGVDCIPVVIDLMSLGLMKGATLHHATELIGSSFRIQNNPQAKEGGACGCGVSWEAKL